MIMALELCKKFTIYENFRESFPEKKSDEFKNFNHKMLSHHSE